MANLKKNGVGDEDHILNRGGDTELTDDRGSHDDPNQKSSVAIWGRSNSRSHWERLQDGSRDLGRCQDPILIIKSAAI